MRATWELPIAVLLAAGIVYMMILVAGDGKVRTGERARAHAVLDSTLVPCPDSDIVFQTSTSNRGGVAWFSARCEVKP